MKQKTKVTTRERATLLKKADYEKTIEKIKNSKMVEKYRSFPSSKGKEWVTFSLKKYPQCPIQLLSDGTIIFRFNTNYQFEGIRKSLPKVVVFKKRSPHNIGCIRKTKTENIVDIKQKIPLETQVILQVKNKTGKVIKKITLK